jgi:hypothetical protein
MICPHCRSELPETSGTGCCPVCGKDLPGAITIGPATGLKPYKINAFKFFLALLGPTVLTLLSALVFTGPNAPIPVFVGLVGGGLGGMICGIMLGCRSSDLLGGRIFSSLIFSAMFAVVGIVLCTFGCGFGGYQYNIH